MSKKSKPSRSNQAKTCGKEPSEPEWKPFNWSCQKDKSIAKPADKETKQPAETHGCLMIQGLRIAVPLFMALTIPGQHPH